MAKAEEMERTRISRGCSRISQVHKAWEEGQNKSVEFCAARIVGTLVLLQVHRALVVCCGFLLSEVAVGWVSVYRCMTANAVTSSSHGQ